jgi:hypothetical protein
MEKIIRSPVMKESTVSGGAVGGGGAVKHPPHVAASCSPGGPLLVQLRNRLMVRVDAHADEVRTPLRS